MNHEIEQILQQISVYLPDSRIVQAVIIVIAAVLLSRLVALVIDTTLKRLARKTRSDLDDKMVAFIQAPLVKTIVLAGLALAVANLGLDDKVVFVTVKLLLTIMVIVWAFPLAGLLKSLFGAASSTREHFGAIQPTTLPLFNNVGKILVWALAVFVVIVVWDLDATGWMASAGVVGLAVGFAAKDTLSNLIAGVFIMADAQYKIDDLIILDSGERGQVTHIGLRSTRLLTRDDIEITVPNAVMGQAKITNETAGPNPQQRLRVPVGVAYGSDIDLVREILLRVALDEKLISGSPEAQVRFRAFGASSLDFELLCWISDPLLKGRAIDRLLCDIDREFRKHRVEIPFPQQDVYIKQLPPNVT